MTIQIMGTHLDNPEERMERSDSDDLSSHDELKSLVGKDGNHFTTRLSSAFSRGGHTISRAFSRRSGGGSSHNSSIFSRKSSDSNRPSSFSKIFSKKTHSSSRPSLKSSSSHPRGRGFTSWLSSKLSQHSHKTQLRSFSAIERKSAQGHPIYRNYVKKQVSLANRGDSRAITRVRAMKLTRSVRLASNTPTDRKYLAHGNKLARGVLRKDPNSIKRYEKLKVAAKKGDPRAKKILEGADLSAAVITTIQTGRVVLPKSSVKQKEQLVRQARVARQKAAKGKISRQEALTGAKAAKQLGDKSTEAYLLQAANKAPPAKPSDNPQQEKRRQEESQTAETQESSSPAYEEAAPASSPTYEETSRPHSPQEPDNYREIQELYTKLWTEHAVQLAEQDQKSGRPSKSQENYEILAKLWAKNEMAKQGISTSNLSGDPAARSQRLLDYFMH